MKAGSSYKFNTGGVRLEMIPAFDETDVNTTCDGVLKLTPDTYLTSDEKKAFRLKHYLNCPGTCLPIPFVEVPFSIVDIWLQMNGWKGWPISQQRYAGDLMVSCSLTLELMYVCRG